jgi:hypothetical protein
MRLEFWPDVLGNFALQVSHLVRQAALANRARQAFLDRADHAGRPVAGHQERVGQAAPTDVLKELLAARGVLLGPRRQMQQRLLAVRQDPQAASTASRG